MRRLCLWQTMAGKVQATFKTGGVMKPFGLRCLPACASGCGRGKGPGIWKGSGQREIHSPRPRHFPASAPHDPPPGSTTQVTINTSEGFIIDIDTASSTATITMGTKVFPLVMPEQETGRKLVDCTQHHDCGVKLLSARDARRLMFGGATKSGTSTCAFDAG